MSVEADLVAYLDTQLSESATANPATLQEGPIGEAPDSLIAVTHYAPEESDDYVMGASLSTPGHEAARVLVMARSSVSKASAYARARAAYLALQNLQAYTASSGARYLWVEGHGLPRNLGMDQNGRWLCAFDVTAKVANA